MADVSIALTCDTSALQRLFADFLQCGSEICNAFVHGLESLGESAFTARIDLNVGSAPGAFQQRIVLEPSEALLELATALRAG